MSNDLLFTLTSTINFISLTSSVWLGLYILTRNPKNKLSWMASATLWSLAGSFLNLLIFIHAPPETGMLPWWWGWSVAIAIPFGFHLSVSLLPPALGRKQTWLVILIYFATLNLVAMETYTALVHEKSAVELPLTNAVFHPGPLYPLFGIFLILIPGISLTNLYRGWRSTKVPVIRRQFILLILGAGMAILSAVYTTVSTWYGLMTPTWPGDLALGLSVSFLGYGVVRINALLEGRAFGRDFLYTLFVTVLVIGVYLVAALFSNLSFGIPFIAFIFIIMLAIISHSLIDWGRGRLERFFYRAQSYPELRSELREFSRTTTSDHDLKERLETIMNILCQTLSVRKGFIALREGDGFCVTVGGRGEGIGMHLASPHLFTDEVHILPAESEGMGLEGTQWVVPLVAGGEQVGVIVLEQRFSSEPYSEDELILLEDFADIVASVIHGIRLQEGNLKQIGTLIMEVQETERKLRSHMLEVVSDITLHPFLNLKNEDEAISLLEDSLRHLYDFSFLGTNPLAMLNIVKEYLQVESGSSVTHIDRGKAVQELLVAAIEKLRPTSPKPSPPSKEWHQYVILNDCYVEGKLNREVMGALFIGEGTFNRARRRAVRAITRVIAEMERNDLEN